MKSKNDKEFHQEEQTKRAGEAPADTDVARLLQEVSASRERADNLLRNGVLGPHQFLAEFERLLAEQKTTALPDPLLQELDPFGEDKDAERVRLRAERELPKPELSPITEWPVDGKPIPVWGAARLLEIAFRPPGLFPKPSDSGERLELIRIDTDRARDDYVQEILRWEIEGRIHLIHPTSGIRLLRHPNPGPDWIIDRETFDHIKNALANGGDPAVLPEPAVIDATVPPNEGGPGAAVTIVDHETAPAGDQPLSAGAGPVAQAGVDWAAEFVEWMETEKKARGKYPGRDPGKDGQDGHRKWAKNHKIRRGDVEKFAKHHGLTERLGAPKKKSKPTVPE
jgi:hypothetical protein